MSKHISVPYGNTVKNLEIPRESNLTIITAPERTYEKAAVLLKDALNRPINSRRLEDLVTAQDRVVIIVNDQTRPGPTPLIVDAILERVATAGVRDSQISFVVATGSHRAPTTAELDQIIGPETALRFKTESHDCLDDKNLVYCGTTSSGLPLYINKTVAEATFRITTGLIAPHHTAGFSGGRKSIVPGVAGIKTLRIHHSLPIRPYEPAMGIIDGNSFHESALEGAKSLGVQFIVNAVQDPNKQYIAFVAGDMVAAHDEGVRLCRSVSEVKIPQLADVVITSPGGFPRDINLYQSQKAVSPAEFMVKPGGTIILVAECTDGFGEGVFREWMVAAKKPEDVIERFRREGYSVGNNKAFMFARALTKAHVIIVSEKLREEELQAMMLDGADSLEEALEKAKSRGDLESILVMPKAVSMIPIVEKSARS
jgi:lactate racemase